MKFQCGIKDNGRNSYSSNQSKSDEDVNIREDEEEDQPRKINSSVIENGNDDTTASLDKIFRQ